MKRKLLLSVLLLLIPCVRATKVTLPDSVTLAHNIKNVASQHFVYHSNIVMRLAGKKLTPRAINEMVDASLQDYTQHCTHESTNKLKTMNLKRFKARVYEAVLKNSNAPPQLFKNKQKRFDTSIRNLYTDLRQE